MWAYYNETDAFKAEWLRQLMKAGAITEGEVDERDVRDVAPDDLRGFRRCHFFAGIGVWDFALRESGWPEDQEVWTGSCPCQPFSAAGKRGGFGDERHLWPDWLWLVGERRPEFLLGEQVAGKDGLDWLGLVHADLEAHGYTLGANVACSAGFGASDLRHRSYWVAHPLHAGRPERRAEPRNGQATGCSGLGGLADPAREQDDAEPTRGLHTEPGERGWTGDSQGTERELSGAARSGRERATGAGGTGRVADADGIEHQRGQGPRSRILGPQEGQGADDHARGRGADGVLKGFWSDADWCYCTDGKWRPFERGSFPLAPRSASTVGRLRGYGNALNAEVAKGWVEAVKETLLGGGVK